MKASTRKKLWRIVSELKYRFGKYKVYTSKKKWMFIFKYFSILSERIYRMYDHYLRYFVLGLILFEKLELESPTLYKCLLCFFTCMILSIKYNEDKQYTFDKVFSIKKNVLHMSEKDVFENLGFGIHISKRKYDLKKKKLYFSIHNEYEN